MRAKFEGLAQGAMRCPRSLVAPDFAGYETYDDEQLIALVEELRPYLYAYASVVINRATPLVQEHLPPPEEGEYDGMVGLLLSMQDAYADATGKVFFQDDIRPMIGEADSILEVLRFARLRGVYDQIEPEDETPCFTDLVNRGCATGLLVSTLSLDYIYDQIRLGFLTDDPYDIAHCDQLNKVISTFAMRVAMQVGVQNIGPLVRKLCGLKEIFVRQPFGGLEVLPVELTPPFRVRLKEHVDEIRKLHSTIQADVGSSHYTLEHLKCPAVVSLEGVDPIPNLVGWVIRTADDLKAFDLRSLKRCQPIM